MTDNRPTDANRHDRHVEIIARATGGILKKFGPSGVTPLAAFEGCAKGAVVALLSGTGCTLADAADALEDFAAALRPAEGEADPTRATMQ